MTTSSIDAAALPRIEADVALAEASGLYFKQPTLFEPGTRLYESGVKTARRSRAAFEARPLLEDAADEALKAFQAQKREDVVLDCRYLQMSPTTGHIFRTDSASRHPEDHLRFTNDEAFAPRDRAPEGIGIGKLALGQLISRVGGPGSSASYLDECPVELRAYNVNHWFAEACRDRLCRKPGATVGQVAEYEASQPVHAMVRTMLAERNQRSAYAVLSPNYRVRDMPDLIPVFMKKVAEMGATGARGGFRLCGPRWQYRATFHSPLDASLIRVGDIFRGAFWMEGVDDGTGSVRIGAGVEKARCVNLTTVWAKEVTGLRHNARDFDIRFGELLEQGRKAIEGFASKWAEAERQEIIEGIAGGADPQKLFAVLVRKGLVKIPGYSKEEMVERLQRAWQVEPGYMKTDIVNAITRCAHEETWRSPWQQDELETQAGQLLYNHVVLNRAELEID